MDEFTSRIEALEHRWMRAWMQRDRNQMKALAARDFIVLFGAHPPAMLDRPSWLEAATTRLRCKAYRFEEVYVRRHGPVAVFSTQMTIEAEIGNHEWSGQVWVTDLWKRSMSRRKWRLIERSLARPDSDVRLAKEIRAMQLWR